MDEAGPKSDFSKIVQKQWQEDQLKDQIAKLEEEREQARRKIQQIESQLAERDKQIQELHAAATREIQARDEHIKKMENALQSKEDMIASLKRDINITKTALEEERSKSFGQFISSKLKKK